ncbi:MAG TPA: tetratricopeptide repeat protein [Syntrophales bacterium]|nr:tetratricopeptide repeat protein [Syntrophales bacterium]
MKSFFAFIVCLVILSAIIPVSADAKSVEFTREYTYQASEADSKLTSRAITLEQIKRLLLEELGTFLTSRTEVRDAQLTKDEIVSFTGGTVATIIITERWNGSEYYMKAQIKADPDQVTEAIMAIKKNEEDAEELQRLRTKADDSLKEIERLRKEVAELKKSSSLANSDRVATVQKEYDQTVAGLSAKDITQQGLSLLREKQYPQAIEQFNKAIDLDSKAITPYILRGSAFIQMKEYEKAIDNFNQAIAAMPKEAAAYFHRGRTYFIMKEYDKAMDDLTTVLRLRPGHVGALIMKANIYSQQREYSLAVAELEKAVQLHKWDYAVLCELGNIYYRTKRFRDSVRVLSSAIEMKPSVAIAYMFRSRSYRALRMNSKAMEDLKAAAGLGNKVAQNMLERMKKGGPRELDKEADEGMPNPSK